MRAATSGRRAVLVQSCSKHEGSTHPPLLEGMDTIKLIGAIYRGTHYGSVGVYTHKRFGHTYAGERKGGVAHGHGVLTRSDGITYSGQLADGQWHGHREYHCAGGDVDYGLLERGNLVHVARVRPDGDCFYGGLRCGADHADFAALKAAAQQATVRTFPLPASNACPRRRPNPDAHAVRFSHPLRFGAWRRAAALGVRVQLCTCVCVRASVSPCACACVYLCVRVRARSCVRGGCESVCAHLCAYAARFARARVCVRICVCQFVCAYV
jgi:hypothetical protein